jgi:MFS superfamily sulfate permease-like transporter
VHAGIGSLTRSAINQQAGAQTQWSGVVSAIAVALIMLAFAPYARVIPRSALAGLLMLTAARMVNPTEVRYHMRVSRFDGAIVAVTAIAALAISIEFCVLIGVFMSFLLAVPRTGQMLLTEFVVSPEGTVAERIREDEVCGRLLIFGLEGEMYFGSGVSLEAHLDTIEDRVGPDTKVVVLRLKRARNPEPSQDPSARRAAAPAASSWPCAARDACSRHENTSPDDRRGARVPRAVLRQTSTRRDRHAESRRRAVRGLPRRGRGGGQPGYVI